MMKNHIITKTLILLIFIECVLGNSCGGNCPIGNCPQCTCGTQKNMVDIGQWCAKYSWNQACCKCIVAETSGGNTNAVDYYTLFDVYNIGLWEIPDDFWGQCNDGKPPCDPQENLKCAVRLYQKGGNSWDKWPWIVHAGCGC